jgi:hypothetical protein
MAGLALNPHARIGPAEPPGNGLVVTVPQPGAGLRSVELNEAAAAYGAVSRLRDALETGSTRIPSADLEHLRALGLVTEKAAILTPPRLRIALRAARDAARAPVAVELSGELSGEDPARLHETVRKSFEPGPRFWHTPPGGSGPLPWWPHDEAEPALRALVREGRAVVPGAVADALAAAWIVSSPELDEIERELAAAAADLRRQHYARLRVLPPALLRDVTRYYQALVDGGFLTYEDSAPRYWAHNDGVGKVLHDFILAAVRKVVGRPLKASYSYFSGYRNEAVLAEHVDREQCKFTLNAVLDYRPAPHGPVDWPLVLRTGDEVVELRSRIGGSVIFEGGILAHRRPMLPRGHECDVILLHFVDESFDGPLG